MEANTGRFIRFLATERGQSDAYQASVRQTLDGLAGWMKSRNTVMKEIGTDELAAFLSQRKTEGLNAASPRITTVDISTTQIYTHVDRQRLKSVHKQFHPRG